MSAESHRFAIALKVGFICLSGSGWKAERRVQEYREDC